MLASTFSTAVVPGEPGLVPVSSPREERAADLLALLGTLLDASNCRQACGVLADALQQRFGLQLVAVGLCRGKSKRCRLEAISSVREFDRQSELARSLSAVLEEAALGKTSAPPSNEPPTVARRQLQALLQSGEVWSAAFGDGRGQVLGVVIGAGPQGCSADAARTLRAVEPYLGRFLTVVQRGEPGALRAATGRLAARWHGWRTAIWLAVLLASAGILAMPMPYKITCTCQVQPALRRYVVAPFEAKLQQTVVEPGDVVAQGQALAWLDGREIRWELTGLRADYERAQKTRDTSLAGNDMAQAQMAALEMERLATKTGLLEERMEMLQVRAPISGLVVSGDLKKTEGAPLARGQVLFEIAPLDEVYVELRIPDEEISRVEPGQRVAIRLDAYGGQSLEGSLRKVHPRAEVCDNENVFLGEVFLENSDQALRPGMNGEAKIIGDEHPLAWNLFHRAYEHAAGWLGW